MKPQRGCQSCSSTQSLRRIAIPQQGWVLLCPQPLCALALETPAFWQQIVQHQLLDRLGLAQKMGCVILGAEAVAKLSSQPLLLFVATDASFRLRKKFPKAHVLLTCAQLSCALGRQRINAAAMKSPRLSRDTRIWLDLWYESAAQANKVITDEKKISKVA